MMKVLVRILFFFVLLALANSQLGGRGFINVGKSALTNPLDTALETAGKLLEAFKEFKTTFKKTYSSPAEEKKRLEIFTKNFNFITNLGKNVLLPFKVKLNELADLTVEEFNRLLNGFKIEHWVEEEEPETPKVKRSNDKDELPKSVDWRDKGAVLPARFQGECGSCYAFSAAAALEALSVKQNETLEYLSPQNIIDCIKNAYIKGCNGGVPHFVFNFVKNRGISTEADYKYEEKQGKSCQKKNKKTLTVKGSKYMQNFKDHQLEEAVNNIGPVVVGIDASHESFQFYSEGVYYEPKCNPSATNHAVLLIGYGVEANGDKYWLIKNSYGTSWGTEGFGKIAKNETNHCGINTYAAYPL